MGKNGGFLRFLTFMMALVASSSVCGPALAADIYVGAGEVYKTIQSGIDAASGGDVVTVRDGRYTGTGNKDIDLKGKAITVKSENGPDNCIIDMQGSGRGFYFHNSETSATVVSGFTITGGSAYSGGGICFRSTPTVAHCIITNNQAQHYGGGICFYASPNIVDCVITGNTSLENGGGIYCYSSISCPSITGCTVINNYAVSSGGGIYCGYSSLPVMTNCTIANNITGLDGGGIYCEESTPNISLCNFACNVAFHRGGGIACESCSPSIVNCEIAGNKADSCGGGIHCNYSSPAVSDCALIGNNAYVGGGIDCSYHSNPVIANCTIRGNKGAWHGGGAYCSSFSSPAFTNCTITNNTASYGGGVCCSYASPIISSCTIADNLASAGGGGIYCDLDCYPAINSCILWNNAPEQVSVCSPAKIIDSASANDATNSTNDEIHGYPSIPVVAYCDVEGGWEGDGNIDADPLFLNQEAEDYHLQAGSPCIDAGTPSAGSSVDFDGEARPRGQRVDMGADEFVESGGKPNLIPYSPSEGSAAIMVSSIPGGPDKTDLVTGDSLYVSYAVINSSPTASAGAFSVKLYVDGVVADVLNVGALESGAHTSAVDRQIAPLAAGSHILRLVVDDGNAIAEISESDNSIARVILVSDEVYVGASEAYDNIQAGVDAVPNGGVVIVKDGVYTGDGNKNIDFKGKSITVKSENGPARCIVDMQGTGVGFYFHTHETSSSILSGLTIKSGAGGIVCDGSSPIITNCIIIGNSANFDGGGIYCDSSSAVISDCVIAGNRAGDGGGGFTADSARHLSVTALSLEMPPVLAAASITSPFLPAPPQRLQIVELPAIRRASGAEESIAGNPPSRLPIARLPETGENKAEGLVANRTLPQSWSVL